MASIDRYGDVEHAGARPARSANLAWLNEATTWFSIAIAGMLIVFAGLAVDAYRHNHGATEESLLSLGNPGHLLAAIGLAITSVAVLAGLSVAALRGVTTADHAIRRFVPVTAAWVVLTTMAIASVTYIGASGVTIGHNHDATTTAVTDTTHTHTTDTTGGEAGGVAQALSGQGIDTSGGGSPGGSNGGQDPSQVPGALTQGSNGQPGHVHDHGQQPTFTQLETLSQDQLMPLFPPDTISAADFPLFKQQVEQVRAVAEKFKTPADAIAGGYVRTTSDVPYMGEHYLNYNYVKSGIFDPAHPQGLLFSKIDNGEEKLVGVWFLLIPGLGGNTRDVEPVGFAGNLDLWHAHTGLCLTGFTGASEGETRESCSAKGGSYTADLRWMMHVWVTPETTENPAGVFAYLNNDLFQKQQAVAKTTSAPSGVTP
jgi:hypothetical protein